MGNKKNENVCRYCNKVVKGLINNCNCDKKNEKLWNRRVRKFDRIRLKERNCKLVSVSKE